MHSLILYRAKHEQFDLDFLTEILKSCPHVCGIRAEEDLGASLQIQFKVEDTSITALLSKSRDAIFIRGTHRPAIKTMILLKQYLPNIELRLCDSDNSFDISLTDSVTVLDVEQHMLNELHD